MKEPGLGKQIVIFGKTQLQRLCIAGQFFGENGLANHAAAGAYGFLLSAAPALLMVSFFLLAAFRSSPGAIVALVRDIPFLEVVFDEEKLTRDFLTLSKPGISGLISAAGIFWAGRVFAVSLQRGLTIIFAGTKKRNPLTANLIVSFIEFLVLLFALAMILCSPPALRLYGVLNVHPWISSLLTSTAKLRFQIIPLVALGLISYCSYRIVPVNAPSRRAALGGMFCCMVPFVITVLVLRMLINQTRYNFLYGALGNLMILLVNVYFFFIFFFYGAQLAFVLDSFDALLFAKLRQLSIKPAGTRVAALTAPARRLFLSTEGKLEKYFRAYAKGETIFSRGDRGEEIYYLLEGEVDVYISSADGSGEPDSTLQAGAFFGEVGHLLSEPRSATVRAKTGVSTLALPPPIFDDILKYDAGLDRTLIEHLSRRLKTSNALVSDDTGC